MCIYIYIYIRICFVLLLSLFDSGGASGGTWEESARARERRKAPRHSHCEGICFSFTQAFPVAGASNFEGNSGGPEEGGLNIGQHKGLNI